jgi:hypothetical protein
MPPFWYSCECAYYCVGGCTTVREYFHRYRLFEYVCTMLSKYHDTSAMSMSAPKQVHSPKQFVFWKWRDGGIGTCHQVERSPTTRPVVHPQPPQQPRVPDQQSDVSFSRTSNKREDTCTKMGEREMVRQVGMNPFLQTDYVKGIEIRDKFLIPYHESKPSYDQESGVSGK